MTTQISIIDDYAPLLTSLSLQFQSYGYSTITFSNPLVALEHHAKYPADAYIIDLKMPFLTGVKFYQALCKQFNVDTLPALFLTAVDTDEVKSLKETTISDYVLKPFNFEVLHARVEKILKRFKPNEKVYAIGNLKLFEEKILCTWFDTEIEFTKSEFALLCQLAKRPQVAYTRAQLLDVCCPDKYEVEDRCIDSHVKRIRQKFRKVHPKDRPKDKFDRIKMHYGIGYAWICRSLHI